MGVGDFQAKGGGLSTGVVVGLSGGGGVVQGRGRCCPWECYCLGVDVVPRGGGGHVVQVEVLSRRVCGPVHGGRVLSRGKVLSTTSLDRATFSCTPPPSLTM